ncbi:GNAT family N-acetyltransferase [Flavobacterium degerlachei]|jgi:predicted GNAT family N-acyltransferase|uniref:Acetyltransferase (GNAT) domain-containing protein n=1 Tax=Flavobacterium degerlachei TaxID=229203 RepID=A0A1H3C9C9_9FLAO|nr:GNAT family N-acetyltransferase [Flavobacterium degerlachei]SDX50767.1 Acetyltransferase (GNAT) domain-containing protein [Flavobacterium degerlachei]
MISIQLIDSKNDLYQLERELRNKILLRPIGIPDHAWEMHDEKSWHFVAVENDDVIGCVVLAPLDQEQTKTQLMQMAVETNQQGKGIGKLLVNELLAFSKSKGIKEVVCHSRDNAVPFYLNLGFEIYDAPFVEVGIKHYHMRINLDN